MPKRFSHAGLTLLELVIIIAVLAILTGGSVYYATDYYQAIRYELTRQKMEAIRTAILGDASVSAANERTNFGYLGDMGSLPTDLVDLTTIGSQSPWAVDGTTGLGAGWKGPYYNASFTGSYTVDKDEWGRSFVWDAAGSPPTLTSYGADGAAGGTSYAKDLEMTFPDEVVKTTVRGIALDGDTPVTSATVVIHYPSGGSLTSANTSSHATNGTFSFSNIPPGRVALAITSGQTIAPKLLTVIPPEFAVDRSLLNYSSSLGKLTLANSPSLSPNNYTVTVNVDSSYQTAVTLATAQCYWTSGSSYYLYKITLNGTTETLGTCAAHGASPLTIGASLQLAAKDTGKAFTLQFASASDCSGTPNLTGQTVTCVLTWTNGLSDSLTLKGF